MSEHLHPPHIEVEPPKVKKQKGTVKRKWTSHLSEFFMLFLAVFCGSLAEYQLEHRIERDREKDFVISAVKEMKLDNLDIDDVEKNDSNHGKYLDTLAYLLLSGDRSQQTIREMYNLSNQINPGWYVGFKRSTITQLKNAGNMRLIRNTAVADSLLGVDGSISNANQTLEELRKLSYDNRRLCDKVFDFNNFVNKNDKSKNKFSNIGATIQLLTNDEKVLHELGNNILEQAGIVKTYKLNLHDHKLYTTRLINFFIKEYHLKDI